MGIKGTVRRSLDSHFIHTNIDIDLIITESPDYGRPDKPEEIFHIIEHFCLGKRRLYLFGRDQTIRPGWLTVGPELSTSHFDKDVLARLFEQDPNGNFTGSSERIDMLRPKTPPLKAKQQQMALNSALNAMTSGNNMTPNTNGNVGGNAMGMGNSMLENQGNILNATFNSQDQMFNPPNISGNGGAGVFSSMPMGNTNNNSQSDMLMSNTGNNQQFGF